MIRKLSLSFAIALTIVGCYSCSGNTSSLRGHSSTAQILDNVASTAKELLFDQRASALRLAKDRATAEGQSEEQIRESVRKAAVEYDSGPQISSVNAFIAAKETYVQTVLASASSKAPSWKEARAILRNVVKAYTNLRAALGSSKIPMLPSSVSTLLEEGES